MTKEEKMKLEAEKAIALEKYKQQIERCIKCEWGRIEDDKVFCPFMEGICMKKRA